MTCGRSFRCRRRRSCSRPRRPSRGCFRAPARCPTSTSLSSRCPCRRLQFRHRRMRCAPRTPQGVVTRGCPSRPRQTPKRVPSLPRRRRSLRPRTRSSRRRAVRFRSRGRQLRFRWSPRSLRGRRLQARRWLPIRLQGRQLRFPSSPRSRCLRAHLAIRFQGRQLRFPSSRKSRRLHAHRLQAHRRLAIRLRGRQRRFPWPLRGCRLRSRRVQLRRALATRFRGRQLRFRWSRKSRSRRLSFQLRQTLVSLRGRRRRSRQLCSRRSDHRRHSSRQQLSFHHHHRHHRCISRSRPLRSGRRFVVCLRRASPFRRPKELAGSCSSRRQPSPCASPTSSRFPTTPNGWSSRTTPSGPRRCGWYGNLDPGGRGEHRESKRFHQPILETARARPSWPFTTTLAPLKGLVSAMWVPSSAIDVLADPTAEAA